MYDVILVPVDGSDPSDAALDHAAELAATFDATLHVLNVVDLAADAAGLSGGGAANVIQALHDAGEEIVGEAAGRVPEGVPVETAVVEGYPADAIESYAGDVDADLVVMGSHGRTGVGRYLLGSTTERVVRTADRPVLTLTGAE